jgi:transposase
MQKKRLHSGVSYNRLERGRFIWPQADSGCVALTPAQLSMLLEGIDWRHPVRTAAPSHAA